MKLSRLNIRGSLCTLGRLVNEKEFSALICVISTLKSANEKDAEIPEEFSYSLNVFHTESSFFQSCEVLVKAGFCKNDGSMNYSFTNRGKKILEAWSNEHLKKENCKHWYPTRNQ